ncbi:hypothetical protein BJX68DRAFT_54997 [Aspergillus pseudodeflectus]|uniref:Uncharacterized protein n=1 Tax=Aspergillus pseudodeflectus TaxID=176178 RepID=A0ABR4KK00_9EURO
MNWTGGRLRRHSGPNDKARKQVFKRPTAGSKGPHQITLFNGLAKAQDSEKRGGREGVGESSNAGSQMTRNPPSQQPPPPATNTPNTRTHEPTTRLGLIKRQLLETTDWGVIGVARPVQVSFTPQEELERFGKRRRLTVKDHERLNTSTVAMGMARPSPRSTEIRMGGGLGENLEIRMDGRRIGQGNGRASSPNMLSSQYVEEGTSPDMVPSGHGQNVAQLDEGLPDRASSIDEGAPPDVIPPQNSHRFGQRDTVVDDGIPSVRDKDFDVVYSQHFGQLNEHLPRRASSVEDDASPNVIFPQDGRQFGQRDAVANGRIPSIHVDSLNTVSSQHDRRFDQENPFAIGRVPSVDEGNAPNIACFGQRGAGCSGRLPSIDEGFSSNMVSSQSMLLDYEGSIGSNNRASAQDSFASMNSTGRSFSLSRLSDAPQLGYVPDVPGMPEAFDTRGIIPHLEDTSGSMKWASEEPIEQLRSQESSSIIPLPTSPVRRRFTIDDQVDAERERRLMRPPAVAEPSRAQGYGERLEAPFLYSPSRPADAFARLNDAMEPPSRKPDYPKFSWLPDPGRSMHRTESNRLNARSPMASIREDPSSTNFSRLSRDVAPMTIFGQPVSFQDPGVRADNHAMRQSGLCQMKFDHGDAHRFSSDGALTSPPGFWSRRV